MPLTRVYTLLEHAQDELRAVDVARLRPDQREAVERLRAQLDATVELAFLAGNLGEPTG